MHVEEVKCCGSRFANCTQACTFQCHHGHTCGKLCHFQTPCKCEFLVEKTSPNCGHQLLIECHSEDDPVWLQVPCEVIVSKVIPRCGHSQSMKCKESPQTQQCQEIVPKRHPLCGHIIPMMCSDAPSRSILCKTVIHKTLACGHKQVQECSAINVLCTVNVLKLMPCGHQQLVPCNKKDAQVTCMERITKKFPKCGHFIEMLCWASAVYLHCLQTITLTKCGHQKTISCDENMQRTGIENSERFYKCEPTCFTKVTLRFACGHSETTQCYLSKTVRQCSDGCCSHILSCGHPCTGKGEECSEKRIHANCTQPCNKRLVCGHQCKSTICGSCSICSNKCERYCPHRKCEHPCSQECPPCKETCSLQCPHHNCSHLCYEECNRPPCNHRCPLTLKCSHPCMGYCGEPCPSLCFECEPDRRNEFSQTCNEALRLVRLLDCGHEHDATTLDKLINANSESVFSALRCPSCEQVIYWHPRYMYRLKQQWHAVDAVKRILLSCLEGSTKHQRFPMVAGGVSDIRTYLRRLNTFLFINETLTTDNNCHVKSQEWVRFTIQRLSACLLDLTITTRSKVFATFNEQLRKLTAVQLLMHMRSKDNESDDSGGSDENDSDDNDDDSTDGDQLHQDVDNNDDDNADVDDDNGDEGSKTSVKAQHLNLKTSSATLTLAAELQTQTEEEEEMLVITKQTFTKSDLSKFCERLLPLLTDSSERSQWLHCPELRGISVHIDDWTRCTKGHVRPSSYAGDNCLECSGADWTVEMFRLMKEIRHQTASKEMKDIDGNIRRKQQLEQSIELEPYVGLNELTAVPETRQNQALPRVDDKRDTVRNRNFGTKDNDLWKTKNISGPGDIYPRKVEGNGKTQNVGTREVNRNWRTGTVEPRATERNWRTGKAEPSPAERNWKPGNTESRATERNWRTGNTEPRETERNWRTGNTEPRETERNWRTGKSEPSAAEGRTENFEPRVPDES